MARLAVRLMVNTEHRNKRAPGSEPPLLPRRGDCVEARGLEPVFEIAAPLYEPHRALRVRMEAGQTTQAGQGSDVTRRLVIESNPRGRGYRVRSGWEGARGAGLTGEAVRCSLPAAGPGSRSGSAIGFAPRAPVDRQRRGRPPPTGARGRQGALDNIWPSHGRASARTVWDQLIPLRRPSKTAIGASAPAHNQPIFRGAVSKV